jgi:hypothetical protein
MCDGMEINISKKLLEEIMDTRFDLMIGQDIKGDLTVNQYKLFKLIYKNGFRKCLCWLKENRCKDIIVK